MSREGITQPHCRKEPRLPHVVPPWVDGPALYFLTCCTVPREFNQLCRPAIADLLKASLEFHQEQHRWRLHGCVLMPDHLHLLVTVAAETNLPQLFTNWKRHAARSCAVRWQRDFFEHRLRRGEHFDAKLEYMRQNPVRAALVL